MAFNGEYVPIKDGATPQKYYNDPVAEVSYPLSKFDHDIMSKGGYFTSRIALPNIRESVTWNSGLIGAYFSGTPIYGEAIFTITRVSDTSYTTVLSFSQSSITWRFSERIFYKLEGDYGIIVLSGSMGDYPSYLAFLPGHSLNDFSITLNNLYSLAPPPNTESTTFVPNALIGVNTPNAVSEVISDTITSYDDCIIPVWSGIDSGAYTVYTPTYEQFSNFTDYLWGVNLDTYITNLIQNPIEIIISSHFLPLETSELPTQTNSEMRFGAVVNTGVNMNRVGVDFVTKDFGEIIIPKVYDSFLDANPNTQIELYLPFCGSFPLDADVVVGNKLKVEYVIQLSTGVCVARVYCAYNVNGDTIYSLLFTADGNCRMECPITMNQTLNNLIASTAKTAINTAVGYVMGGAVGAVSEIASGAAEITSNKNQTQMSGNVGSNVGWLACKTPFVKVVIPKVAITENYADTFGYQSNLSVDDLSTLQGSGFGQIQVTRAQWTDNRLTSDEWEETKRILAKGVIF